MREQLLRRTGRAEAFHADEGAARADPFIPAEAHACLDRDTRGIAQHRAAIVIRLFAEQLHARH